MAEHQRPLQAPLERLDGPPLHSQHYKGRYGKRPRGGGPNNWESRRGRPRRSKQSHAAPQTKKKLTCSQCQEEEPKYKCPKCRIPYCSIACCRAHKGQGCEEKKQQMKQETKSKYLPSDTLLRDPLENAIQRRKQVSEEEDLPEGWKITKEMMDKMDNCDWLRTELEDGGLRQVILQVCDSPNTVAYGQKTHQELAIERAKAKYPNFERFMDKLLVLTGVLERQETEDEELGDWLKRDEDSDLGPLALVPVPRRKKHAIAIKAENDDDDLNSSDSSDESESDDESDSDSSG